MRRQQQMSGALLALLISMHTGSAQGFVPPPLGAKLAETLMGPRTKRIIMSEDGNHLAIVAPKGSREIVLLDGVEGPVFDEIPAIFGWGNYAANGGPIVWSPTGGRSAYVGRRAGDYIAVVDGKEAVTLSTPATLQGMGGTDPSGWSFYFNHDGTHLAYASLAAPGSWVMVLDGVKSPSYHAIDFRQTALIGMRVIYVVQPVTDLKWHLVVDGKVGPAYDTIASLKVTPDGAHYAFVANRWSAAPGAAGGRFSLVVVDGVEGRTERAISDLEQAPDGRVSYMAMRPQTTPGGNPPHLIVGALDATWTTTFGGPVRVGRVVPEYHVAWSADGKRFAYLQQNTPNPGVTVMVNGKPMGPTYNSAGGLSWSPEGSRFAYTGTSPSGTFAVIDGQESDGYHWIRDFQWSPDGKRYAFIAGNATGTWMIVDGKEQPKALGFAEGALRFSPDSRHLAYSAQTTVANFQPVVDGQLRPQYLGNFATHGQFSTPLVLPVFVWSPDGNHLAYAGGKTDGTIRGAIWVDGVPEQGPMQSYFHPAWSPDSKHFAAVTSDGRGWAVLIDGKIGPGYEDLIEMNGESSAFTDGHTFRFYGIKAGQVYRITLDLGA
jgi:Tol biopolymer transport system component